MSFEIFSDSSSNLTDSLIENYNLNIVSLVFISNDKEYISYQKGTESNLQQFYGMLRNKEQISTSCINTETFVRAFEPKLAEGKDILYIGFSSALSGTYNSGKDAALILKKKYPKRKIYTVNTLGASLGEGLLLLYAARQRDEGKTIEEVRDWQEENKLKLCHFFTVDDLFFLFRGGRVKKSNYLIANIINLKPIMHMDNNGALVAIGKVFGRRKSISTIAQMVVDNIINPENQTVCISHGDCIDDVNLLIAKIESQIKVKEWVINYVDPVVGAHSGPGTIAIFFLGDHR